MYINAWILSGRDTACWSAASVEDPHPVRVAPTAATAMATKNQFAALASGCTGDSAGSPCGAPRDATSSFDPQGTLTASREQEVRASSGCPGLTALGPGCCGYVEEMDEVQIDDQGRPEPPLESGEVPTLLGFLDYQRATLEWKTRGLGDDQLRVALPPTSMTLGGLLKHMAYVEDHWFTKVVAGEEAVEPWAGVDWKKDPDWEWHSAADDSGEQLRALWSERVERSRNVVDAQLARGDDEALGESHLAWGGRGSASFRWILVHMIEEYSRHNGHADLIRESIDGETGE